MQVKKTPILKVLNPEPYTLHPKPLNRKTYTPNPKPQTQVLISPKPKPEALRSCNVGAEIVLVIV